MSVCANCKLHSKEVYVNKNRFRKITMNPFSFPLKKWFPSKEVTMPEVMKESIPMAHISPIMCK